MTFHWRQQWMLIRWPATRHQQLKPRSQHVRDTFRKHFWEEAPAFKRDRQQTYKVVIHISGQRQGNWAPRSVFNLLKITQRENGRAGIWTHVFLTFKFALLSMTLFLRWPRTDEGSLRTSEFGREHELSLIVGSQTYVIRLMLDQLHRNFIRATEKDRDRFTHHQRGEPSRSRGRTRGE